MKLDLSAYLVTDSTMIPQSSTFLSQVKQAVEHGATIVQLREKNILTKDFIKRANAVLEITRRYGVPLIINDRVDVALAVGADGVHVGQDDMPAKMARQLIGPDKILGVSCGNTEETKQVCLENVADYVGLGTLYPTQTKDVKNVCGPIGVRQLLQVLKTYKSQGIYIKSVAIGGINLSNAAKVLHQCQVPGHGIDGVAFVSCVMAAEDASGAMKSLVTQLTTPPTWIWEQTSVLLEFTEKPLVHHITNNVVKNFCASVTLAVGGSPIMSELQAEFEELASLPLPNALVVNLGTPSAGIMEVFVSAIKSYNNYGRPIIFDPVGAGASHARSDACRAILNSGHVSIIKGNLGEMLAIDKFTSTSPYKVGANLMRGVDSIASMDGEEIETICKRVATEFQCVAVVTGKVNYVFDGTKPESPIAMVSGGSKLMGSVVGTGCALGSVIATFAACARSQNSDLGKAVVSAVQLYNVAGKRAEGDAPGMGLGTYKTNFLDQLAPPCL